MMTMVMMMMMMMMMMMIMMAMTMAMTTSGGDAWILDAYVDAIITCAYAG